MMMFGKKRMYQNKFKLRPKLKVNYFDKENFIK